MGEHCVAGGLVQAIDLNGRWANATIKTLTDGMASPFHLLLLTMACCLVPRLFGSVHWEEDATFLVPRMTARCQGWRTWSWRLFWSLLRNRRPHVTAIKRLFNLIVSNTLSFTKFVAYLSCSPHTFWVPHSVSSSPSPPLKPHSTLNVPH